MTSSARPHDPFTERAVVGALLAGEPLNLDPTDVWDPHLRVVAEVCVDLTATGRTPEPVLVRSELLRRGVRTQAADGAWLFGVYESRMPGAEHHVGVLHQLALRRRLLEQLERAQQEALDPGSDPGDVAASVTVACTALADGPDHAPASSAQDLYEFLDGPDDYDWLVPGLLERGDRLLITGGEGSGKSVMLRQVAVATAAGVHPFDGSRNDPRRVLLIDLENGQRTLRRHLIGLRQHCDQIGRPVPLRGLTIESLPAGTDLTRPDGEAWLSRLCSDHQPDLLVIGPLYRMHARNMNDEEPARQLTRVVDLMRARHGCSVAMETHAPHTTPGALQRNLRPVGSSLFMRWPEFGFGLRPAPDHPMKDAFEWVPWRGPREERSWPRYLCRGGPGDWPWMGYQDGPATSPAVRGYWSDLQREGA